MSTPMNIEQQAAIIAAAADAKTPGQSYDVAAHLARMAARIPEMASVFASAQTPYTDYRCTIALTNRIAGGQPRNRELIEPWLAKAGFGDDAKQVLLLDQLQKIGANPANPEIADVQQAAEDVAEQTVTTFYRDDAGVYMEGRTMKALIKESIAVNYGGERTLKMKDDRYKGIGGVSSGGKGYRSATAERVFVDEHRIRFYRPDGTLIAEPDGQDLFIGHVTGPQGKRSTLSYFDYIAPPAVAIFTVKVLDNFIQTNEWERIWQHAEYNGWGAKRSQGFGTFKVIDWARLEDGVLP